MAFGPGHYFGQGRYFFPLMTAVALLLYWGFLPYLSHLAKMQAVWRWAFSSCGVFLFKLYRLNDILPVFISPLNPPTLGCNEVPGQ